MTDDNVIHFRTAAQRRADEARLRAQEDEAKRRQHLYDELAAIASIRRPLEVG